MKSVVTGTHGTVAPVLVAHLRALGRDVVAWDRAEVPPDDADACARFLAAHRPGAVFHLATGSPSWAERLAALCRESGARLLYTSSASVFSGAGSGPIPPDAEPDATDDYGRYKADCERLVRAANPDALVARIGWQIGDRPGSNNMFDYLHRRAEEGAGRIEASANWLQSCSFLEDTVDGLRRLADEHPAGTYHLDGNPGLTFFEIATAVVKLSGRDWTVVRTEAPVLDNRLAEDRISIAPITSRFV